MRSRPTPACPAHRASRIAAKANAGKILVPDTVRGLLSGKGFMFGDRGEFVP